MNFVEFVIFEGDFQEKIALREEDIESFSSCGEKGTLLKVYKFSRTCRRKRKLKTLIVDEPFETVLKKLNQSRDWL